MRRTAAMALVVCLSACGGGLRPFALRDVVWRDDDMRPFAPPPPELYTPPRWDSADHTIFRQLSRFSAFELVRREAVNANALDEVPDSSWFKNRIGRYEMIDEELLRGACSSAEPPPRPWVVTAGKPAGTSPGAVIRAADGLTYLFKIDFFGQPERATAADTIATRMLFAAGYETPCDAVVTFTPDDFEIAPDAHGADGRPYTRADLDALVQAAGRNPDGTRRGSLSRFLDGGLLGGWRFDGLTEGDPNDVIPHEHRREVRGLYVFSAWLNHIDARAENNMSLWVDAGGGRGYVRHLVLDAGDSFGIVWDADLNWGMSSRFGESHYLDTQHILEDLFSLDAIPRGYRDPPRGPEFASLGFYDVERFVPDAWRPGYPNPAFEQRTERDCAWAARIISQMTPHRIAVLVRAGRFSRPALASELERIIVGRRRRLLARWLTRLSPLTQPTMEGDELCLRDLAVESGIRARASRHYSARAWSGLPPEPDHLDAPRAREDGRVCVTLPHSLHGMQRYRIVDVTSTSAPDSTGPARVHLYALPSGEHRIVGLERPADGRPTW